MAHDNEGPDDPYEVGYGKPPKHSRWKKGQSGNPKGPRRKSGSIRERVQAMLDQKVTSTAGERMTYSDAILRMAMSALVGKGTRSIKGAIELIRFLETFDKKVSFEPTVADEARLAQLIAELGTKRPSGDDDAQE